MITGPNTLTDAVANRKEMSGVVAPGGGVAVNRFTQCSTDTFSVSNPDGPSPPAICGTNSNEHSEFFMTVLLIIFFFDKSCIKTFYHDLVYVEASDDCNTLSFVFGAIGVGATVATRQFSIKAGQLGNGRESVPFLRQHFLHP